MTENSWSKVLQKSQIFHENYYQHTIPAHLARDTYDGQYPGFGHMDNPPVSLIIKLIKV